VLKRDGIIFRHFVDESGGCIQLKSSFPLQTKQQTCSLKCVDGWIWTKNCNNGQNKPDPSLRRTAAKWSPLGYLDVGAARITAKGSEEAESGDDLMVDEGPEGIVTMPMYPPMMAGLSLQLFILGSWRWKTCRRSTLDLRECR
jgi:hypothetical protein